MLKIRISREISYSAIAYMLFTMVGFIYTKVFPNPIRDRGYAYEAYHYGMISYLFSAVFAILSGATTTVLSKKRMSQVLALISLMDMTSLFVISYSLNPVLLDVNNYPVDVNRYLSYITTAPIMLLYLGKLNRCDKMAFDALKHVYFTIIHGFVCAISNGALTWVADFFSVVSFIVLMMTFNEMFEHGKLPWSGVDLEWTSLENSKWGTIIFWSGFPITFYAVKFHLISFEMGEVFFVITNVLCKSLLSMILLMADTELTIVEKIRRSKDIPIEIKETLSMNDGMMTKLIPGIEFDRLMGLQKEGRCEFANLRFPIFRLILI
jgi:hypothetical protein